MLNFNDPHAQKPLRGVIYSTINKEAYLHSTKQLCRREREPIWPFVALLFPAWARNSPLVKNSSFNNPRPPLLLSTLTVELLSNST